MENQTNKLTHFPLYQNHLLDLTAVCLSGQPLLCLIVMLLLGHLYGNRSPVRKEKEVLSKNRRFLKLLPPLLDKYKTTCCIQAKSQKSRYSQGGDTVSLLFKRGSLSLNPEDLN